MNINTKIHSVAHLLKANIGNIIVPFLPEPRTQLYVLNYHGTQKKFIDNFIKQIKYLKQRYEIISPEEFEEFVNLKKELKGKKMLLTFDDGVKNNQYAIEELNKLGISAYFFVVPQFINTPIDNQKMFFLKNIRPVINTEIDNNLEDFTALSWDDLKEISKKHTIGCHTYSHTMIKDSLNSEDLTKEIIESKSIIEREIGIKVNSFCSINNTLLTIGKKEKKIVEQNYNYHFTTFGGNNEVIEPFLIKRINVESHWLKGAFKFALSPIEINRWTKKIELYRESTK